ncbi:MAG: DUF5655 domain-containing protein [bacterium]
MPESPGEMIKAQIRMLEEQSGKPLEHWVKAAKKAGLSKHKEIVDWMKSEHGVKHNQALWVGWGVTDPDRITAYEDGGRLMDELYSGRKEHLRPVYDKLKAEGLKLGKDVKEVCCKTYSSLHNKHQFAIINPRTQSAVDLELAMPPGTKETGRLEAFKGSNDKYTHRIRLSDVKEIDRDVLAAFRAASEHVRGRLNHRERRPGAIRAMGGQL